MTLDAVSTTAVEAWDKRWATEEGRADWFDPHPAVVARLPELTARGARRALDLGCGVGRHALLLAEHGLEVEALDGSPAGLAVARETAAALRAHGEKVGVLQVTLYRPWDSDAFLDAMPKTCRGRRRPRRRRRPPCARNSPGRSGCRRRRDHPRR